MKRVLLLFLLLFSVLYAQEVYELDGKVGIKVPDPQFELSVKGSIQAINPDNLEEYSLTNAFRTRFVWTTNGLNGELRSCGIFRGYGDTNNRIEIRLWDEDAIGPIEKATFEENFTKIFTDMYIERYLGIGVENPTNRLAVDGLTTAVNIYAGISDSSELQQNISTDFSFVSLEKSYFNSSLLIGSTDLPESNPLLYVAGDTQIDSNLRVNNRTIVDQLYTGVDSPDLEPSYTTSFGIISLKKNYFQNSLLIGATDLPESNPLLYVAGDTQIDSNLRVNNRTIVDQLYTGVDFENISHYPDFSIISYKKNYFQNSLLIGATDLPESNPLLYVAGKSQFDNQVVIGTSVTPNTPSDCKLAVAGKIYSEGVVVRSFVNWPDYVFEEDYNLSSLEEVENFVKANKHLPGVPSAREIEEGNLSLGEMQASLMKKVEELTLYLIELRKQNSELKTRLDDLENK
ncbi:MAG: hypothetical protein PHR06_05195 [Candidatus Cloacimonetes bacterium]|nr:hypothetical protein [Candidatus Cloacimonadota bacterium]